MKKILALVMATLLVLSFSTAFADGLKKTYTVTGKAPVETFSFNVSGGVYKYFDMQDKNWKTDSTVIAPVVTVDSLTFEGNMTESKDIAFHVDFAGLPYGRYEYTMSEVAGSTPGVTYNETVYNLAFEKYNEEGEDKIAYTVRDNNSKISNIENVYQSGTLSVTKSITGNLADMNKKFAFNVKFDFNGNFDTSLITVTGGTDGSWDAATKTYNVRLGNGDVLSFQNLPAGTTYTIEENAENYTQNVNKEKADGTIAAGDMDEAIFTNSLTTGIDTGVNLDSMPYVILMALVVLTGTAMLLKKRYNV